MQITTISDACKRVDYLLQQVIMSLTSVPPADILPVDTVAIKDDAVVVDGWIYITPYATRETVKSIVGRERRKIIAYEISVAKMIHGVRYHKDGTGEPDDVDIITIHKRCKSPDEAVKKAALIWVENDISHVLENINENEFAREDKEFWEGEAKAQEQYLLVHRELP